MGQYHLIVNLDKQEYLDAHKLGDGLKLLEFGASGCGTMCALAILLAKDNGRGGGDLRSSDPLIGRWAGDRIVIAGDYGDDGDMLPQGWESTWKRAAPKVSGAPNLYCYARGCMLDVSAAVREVMCEDSYLAESLGKSMYGSEEEKQDELRTLAEEAALVRKALAARVPQLPESERPADPFEVPEAKP